MFSLTYNNIASQCNTKEFNQNIRWLTRLIMAGVYVNVQYLHMNNFIVFFQHHSMPK